MTPFDSRFSKQDDRIELGMMWVCQHYDFVFQHHHHQQQEDLEEDSQDDDEKKSMNETVTDGVCTRSTPNRKDPEADEANDNDTQHQVQVETGEEDATSEPATINTTSGVGCTRQASHEGSRTSDTSVSSSSSSSSSSRDDHLTREQPVLPSKNHSWIGMLVAVWVLLSFLTCCTLAYGFYQHWNPSSTNINSLRQLTQPQPTFHSTTITSIYNGTWSYFTWIWTKYTTLLSILLHLSFYLSTLLLLLLIPTRVLLSHYLPKLQNHLQSKILKRLQTFTLDSILYSTVPVLLASELQRFSTFRIINQLNKYLRNIEMVYQLESFATESKIVYIFVSLQSFCR